MINKELTVEESDAAILQELNIEDNASDNTTETNNEEVIETDENSTINTDDEVLVEEDIETNEGDSEDEDSEEEDIETTKKPNKFAKLLAKKNEAKREAEEAKKETTKANTRVQELEDKLATLENDGEYGSEEYVKAMVDKRMAEKDEIIDFFDEYAELKTYKKDILHYKEENGLDIDKATKLYLAENNPSLLLTPQSKAKAKSKMYSTTGRTNSKLVKSSFDYSDAEFDKLAASGKITF